MRRFIEAVLTELSDAHVNEATALRLIAQAQSAMTATAVQSFAVVGLECRFPGAPSAAEYWSLLQDGRSAITEIPADRWRLDADWAKVSASRSGGFLPDLQAFAAGVFGHSAAQASVMDVQQRLWLETAWRALRDAGCLAPGRRGRLGIFVGARSIAGILADHPAAKGRDRVVGAAQNYIAARAAQALDARGPVLVVDTACSSSLVSVHLACASLGAGDCDLAIAGGVDVLTHWQTYEALTAAGALAADGRCKVFDANADGYVPGEGAGAVVLKRLPDARRDGDRIMAVVLGSAVNNDGYVMGATNPSVGGQRSVIEAAMRRAGMRPADVGYVEAHGTGTEIGDPIEVRSLMEAWTALGELPERAYIGSAKSNIGHLHSAAGVAGLIKTVLVLSHGQIPRTINIAQVNPRIDFDAIPVRPALEAVGWPAARRVAAVSAFGFGGTNAHVVLRSEGAAPATAGVRPDGPHLVAVSADSAEALSRYCETASSYVERAGVAMAAAARTVACAEAGLEWRSAEILPREPARSMQAFAGRRATKGGPRLGFLFTGQGSQFVGMGRALDERSPAFRAAFDQADAVLHRLIGTSVREAVFGPQTDEEALRQTRLTQPALFALQWAMVAFWRDVGVLPAAVAGHSVGELAAAAVAGFLGLEDACALVARRASAMHDHCTRGKMIVAMAAEHAVRELLADQRLGTGAIAIAAVNSPSNVVVSGDDASIGLFAEIAASRAIATMPLRVSHAFHSPLVEPAAKLLEGAGVAVCGDSGPAFFSTLTGRSADRLPTNYWADQARGAVRFQDAVDAMVKTGRIEAFIEIGPSDTLCRFVEAILGSEPVPAVATASGSGEAWRRTLTAAARLWAAGCTFDLQRLGEAVPLAANGPPPYPLARVDCAASGATPPGGAPRVGHDVGRKLFRRGEDILADHTVKGVAVLPGVTWLELARQQLGTAVGTPLVFRDVIFRAPLSCSSDVPVCAELCLTKTGPASYCADIFIGRDAADAARPDVTFSIEAATAGDGEALALDEVRRRCRTAVPVDTLYRRIRAREIVHGPYYQSVESASSGDGEVLARLRLTPEALATSGELPLHPALVDAATTLGASLESEAGVWSRNSTEPFIPIHIKRVELRRPLPRDCYCHYRSRRDGDDLSSFDMILCDEDGRVFLTIEGFSSKRVRSAARWARQQDKLPAIRRIEWRPVEAGRLLAPARVAVLALHEPEWLAATVDALSARVGVLTLTQLHRRRREQDAFGIGALFEEFAASDRVPDVAVLAIGSAADALAASVDAAEATTALAGAVGAAAALRVLHARAAPDEAGIVSTPAGAAAEGIVLTLQAERPAADVRSISVAGSEVDARLVADELLAERGPAITALSNGAALAASQSDVRPGRDGPGLDGLGPHVVVTGGDGGIGSLLVRRLLGATSCKITVIQRTSRAAEPPDAQRGRVGRRRADVTRRDELEATLAAARVEFGPISAVFHLAGSVGDATMAHLSAASLRDSLATKLGGAIHLDQLTLDDPLAAFVVFSSTASFRPAVGQGAYAAAAAAVDAFACHRAMLPMRRGLSRVIDWTMWDGVGMADDARVRRRFEAAGGTALEPQAALDSIAAILTGGDVRVIVDTAPLVGPSDPETSAGPVVVSEPAAAAAPVDTRGYLVELVARKTGRLAAAIDTRAEFLDLGLDSSDLIDIAEEISADRGQPLHPTALFEHVTIDRLARALGAGPAVVHPVPAQTVPSAAAFEPVIRPEDVAIIGYHGRFPGADDPEALWRLLRDGSVSVGRITRWDPGEAERDADPQMVAATSQAGHLDDIELFDPGFFRISPREAEQMDPQQRILLEVCWDAMRHAGYSAALPEWSDTGVFIGVMNDDYQVEAVRRNAALGLGSGVSNALLANRLSFVFDLKGPSVTMETACSSGLISLHQACMALRRGEARQAIAGAVNLTLSPAAFDEFARFGLLSASGRCRSFAANADGYVRGEGSVALILKRARDAWEDGDTIHAVIRGSAIGHNGRTNGIAAPNPAAQADVISRALADAQVGARSISYVETHGTGTMLGDPVEIEGLNRVFGAEGSETGFCRLGALKANIGHLEAASGLAGVAKVLLALRYGEIPPLTLHGPINPALHLARSPFLLPTVRTPWRQGAAAPRRAGISAFGFGGANAHVVMQEWTDPVTPNALPRIAVVSLSAHNTAAFGELVASIAAFEAPLDEADFPSLVRTLADSAAVSGVGYTFLVRDRRHFREQLVRLGGLPSTDVAACLFAHARGPARAAVTIADQGHALCRIMAQLGAEYPLLHAAACSAWQERLRAIGKTDTLSYDATFETDPVRRTAGFCALVDLLGRLGLDQVRRGDGSVLAGIVAAYAEGRLSAEAVVAAVVAGADETASLAGDRGYAEPAPDILVGLAGESAFELLQIAADGGLATLMARLHAAGAPVRLGQLLGPAMPPRLRLPAYPFQRTRHTVLTPAKGATRPVSIAVSEWHRVRARAAGIETGARTLLLLNAGGAELDALCARHRRWGRIVTAAGADTVSLQAAIAEAVGTGGLDVVHVARAPCGDLASVTALLAELPPLLAALRGHSGQRDLRLVSVVTGKAVGGAAHAVAGALRCASQELAPIRIATLDATQKPISPAALAKRVRAILLHPDRPGFEFLRVGRGGKIFRSVFAETEPAHGPVVRAASPGAGEVWWVVGEGALGGALAANLYGRKVKVAVSSRTSRERAEEQRVLRVRCDLTDPASLASAADTIERSVGAITGIIHAAGTGGSGKFVHQLSSDDLARVCASKVVGTANLHRLCKRRKIRNLVLCGSASASLGGLGLADYAAANAFQDGYAEALAEKGPVVRTIEWDAWEPSDPEALTGLAARLGDTGRSRLSATEAIAAFDTIGRSRPAVYRVLAAPAPVSVLAATRAQASVPHVETAVPPPRDEDLVRIVSEVLKLERADIPEDLPLWDLGADSRILIEVVRHYETLLGKTLALDRVLTRPTIAGIRQAASDVEAP